MLKSPTSFWLPPEGGGLLQGSLPGLGELGDGLPPGEDSEGLEEAGADENLLLCCCCPRECPGQGLALVGRAFPSIVLWCTFGFVQGGTAHWPCLRDPSGLVSC